MKKEITLILAYYCGNRYIRQYVLIDTKYKGYYMETKSYGLIDKNVNDFVAAFEEFPKISIKLTYTIPTFCSTKEDKKIRIATIKAFMTTI